MNTALNVTVSAVRPSEARFPARVNGAPDYLPVRPSQDMASRRPGLGRQRPRREFQAFPSGIRPANGLRGVLLDILI